MEAVTCNCKEISSHINCFLENHRVLLKDNIESNLNRFLGAYCGNLGIISKKFQWSKLTISTYLPWNVLTCKIKCYLCFVFVFFLFFFAVNFYSNNYLYNAKLTHLYTTVLAKTQLKVGANFSTIFIMQERGFSALKNLTWSWRTWVKIVQKRILWTAGMICKDPHQKPCPHGPTPQKYSQAGSAIYYWAVCHCL